MATLLSVFLIALAFPSSNYSLFNGIPFNSYIELAALFLALAVLFSSGARASLAPLIASKEKRLAFLVGVLFVLGAKGALISSQASNGFRACYQAMEFPPQGTETRMTASPPKDARCESLYENPFGLFQSSRIDEKLDFGPTSWAHSFWNSTHYNFFETAKGNFLRATLPFQALWDGTIESDTPLTLVYRGEGAITIDGETRRLEPSYEKPATIMFAAKSRPAKVRVNYIWLDQYRVGDPNPPNEYASIRLLDSRTNSAASPLPPAFGWRVIARIADLFILAVCAVLAFIAFQQTRGERLLIALALAVSTLGFLPLKSAPVVAFVNVLPFGLLVGAALLRKSLSGIAIATGCVAGAIGAVGIGAAGLIEVHLRSAGDDWLMYESQAHSMLETASLMGGEPVFYAQPLFRYFSFLQHLVFGDSDRLILMVDVAALNFGVVLLVASLVPARRTWFALALFGINAATVLFLFNAPIPIDIMRQGLSEYPTWIFLPLTVLALFGSKNRMAWLGGSVLLAWAFFIRTNQAPALVFVLALFAIERGKGERLTTAACVGILVAFAGLILAHNVYYGGVYTIVPTTNALSGNQPLRLGALLSSETRSEALKVAAYQLNYVLYTGNVVHHVYSLILYRTIQLLWLGSTVWLWCTPKVPLTRKALALLPVAYLLVHVFYAVDVYYPRHILAGYFALFIATAFSISRIYRDTGDVAILAKRSSVREVVPKKASPNRSVDSPEVSLPSQGSA